MEVIESNKRGAKLCHAGYMYTKTAIRKNKIWWKCSKRASLNCCASVSTSLDSKNPVPRILHNHGPEEAEIEYAKFRNSMRKKRIEERKNKTEDADCSGIKNIDNNGNIDVLQQQPPQQQTVHILDNQRNTNINNQKRIMKFLQRRRRKKENSQNRFVSTHAKNLFFFVFVQNIPADEIFMVLCLFLKCVCVIYVHVCI